jgi:RNase P/RNase MRP subunit p29
MILLGKTITVTSATNKSLIGLTGTVMEDGKDSLRIQTPQGEKLLVKNTVTIAFDGHEVEGKTFGGTHAARMRK